MPHPANVKDKAKRLFIVDGMNSLEISRRIMAEDSYSVAPETVTAWVAAEEWDKHRAEAELRAMEKMKDIREDRILQTTEKQKRIYGQLIEKAASYLDLDDPDHMIAWDEPEKAVKALDLAMKGEREVEKGIINIAFARTLLTIMQEEIEDQDIKQRIAIRFREASQKFQMDA